MNLAAYIDDNDPRYQDPIMKAFTVINLTTSKNPMILGYIIEVLYRALKYYKIWDELSPLIKSPIKNKLKKVIEILSVIPSNITNNPASNIDNECREIFTHQAARAGWTGPGPQDRELSSSEVRRVAAACRASAAPSRGPKRAAHLRHVRKLQERFTAWFFTR